MRDVAMEFKLDWQTGTDTLTRVFYRPDPLLSGHYGPYSPDTPLYPDAVKGQRYFTSCFTHTPTGGDDVAFIWKDAPSTARLAARHRESAPSSGWKYQVSLAFTRSKSLKR